MQSAQRSVGIWLALVQFFFALTWTVYVIFLPQLAEAAGIPRGKVIFILMLDQAIFALADFAMGFAADRVSRVFGRLGRLVVLLTLLSCLAFLLLPFSAAAGAPLFLALIVLWSVTSSALRAPPLMLLGKYAARPAVPWLSALSLFGLGVAGAVSPYLTVALKNADPRLPFALSAIALALATCGILWAERRLATEARPAAPPVRLRIDGYLLAFLVGAALLGLGFQIHFALNSAPQYLRFAKPADLEWLMPVFWIGFNLLMWPASLWVQRAGGVLVMAAGSVAGALAAAVAALAGSMEVLVAAQFVAGGAWGAVLMSAVAACIALGHTGREGVMTGSLFALLAVATFARMGLVAAQLNKDAQFAPLLAWAPSAAWLLAALLLVLLWRHRPR
jgi:hypothetical protein